MRRPCPTRKRSDRGARARWPWACVFVSLSLALGVAESSGQSLRGAGLADAEASVRQAAEASLVREGAGASADLKALLGHPDFRVRRRALRVALRTADPKLAPVLVDRLAHAEPAADVRAALAFTLVQFGFQAALPHLTRELRHAYWHRRKNAVADLAALRDARAAPFLRAALLDENWLIRHRALQGLVGSSLEEDAEAIAGLMADEEWVLRRDALRALGVLGAGPMPEWRAALVGGAVAAALTDESVVVRRMAAQMAAEGAARPALLAEAIYFGALHDQDAEVRSSLAFATGQDPRDESLARLRALLRDDATIVRLSAAAALAKRGQNDALAAPLASLAGTGAESQPPPALLRTLLMRVGEPAALALLAPACTRGGEADRKKALDALAVFGPTPALRELARRWMDASHDDARVAGARLAQRLGEAGLAEPLTRLVTGPSRPEVVEAAMSALAALSPALGYKARAAALTAAQLHALEALAQRLSGFVVALIEQGPPPELLPAFARAPSPRVRRAALKWMAQLGLGGETVTRALKDADADVRAAALEAWLSAARELPGPGVATRGPLPAGSAAPNSTLSDAERATLRGLLSDPAPRVREIAARAFAETGDARGLSMHRARLAQDATSTDVFTRRVATLELAQLAVRGDLPAARLLAAKSTDADAEVRRSARAGLRRTPAPQLVAIADGSPHEVATWASAHILAQSEHEHPRAALLKPIARLSAADAERIGEIRAPRLARHLSLRLSESAQPLALGRYLQHGVAVELLEQWADALSRDTATEWRGTGPYNMRRQHLYDREVGAAVRLLPGLPPKVLKALLFQESNLEPIAGNQYDCVGLAAFCRRAAKQEDLPMSPLFRDLDADSRYVPARAIEAAVRHLARKADLLEKDAFVRFGAPRGRDYWAFVLAAYNGGHDQVAEAMENAHEVGLLLAKERGLRGAPAQAFARRHASAWENLLAPDEELEDSPLYAMTRRRYAWYSPYGRYRKMKGAEAKYHEIGQFPLDILDRAFEDPRSLAAPPVRPLPQRSPSPAP